MKENLVNQSFDTRMYPSDWRFSATIVGLIRYFKYFNIEYYMDEDCIEYNQNDLTEEKYIEFVNYEFKHLLTHKKMLSILNNEIITDEQIKEINDFIKNGPKIIQDVFKGITFDGSNQNILINIILDNEISIIKGTYYKSSRMYRNYCNADSKKDVAKIEFLLPKEDDYKSTCKLNGYYVDVAKKGKSICYNFDKDTFIGGDIKEFDFIPFAFSHSSKSIFVNNSISIQTLLNIHSMINQIMDDEISPNTLKYLVESIKVIGEKNLTNYNLEIIVKDMNNDYYETLYFTENVINIFMNSKRLQFLYGFRNSDLDISFFDILYRISNNLILDDLIIKLIKLRYNSSSPFVKSYDIESLIDLNYLIYGKGEYTMNKAQSSAYRSAKDVSKVLSQKNATNKIKSYRDKLTSAMSLGNKQKILEILTHISNFTNIQIGIIYDLIEDFDKNKNLVYTFIMSLEKENKEENKGE